MNKKFIGLALVFSLLGGFLVGCGDAGGGGGTWGYHYPEPRPLTNRERARLQTFPDDFVFEGSITEVRRQIGNAVSPDGIVAVVESLIPLFKETYTKVDLYEKSKKLQRKVS